MKRLGVFLLPPALDASLSQGYTPTLFAGTHLHTWVEKGTVSKVSYTKTQLQCRRLGLEPGPLDLEASAHILILSVTRDVVYLLTFRGK